MGIRYKYSKMVKSSIYSGGKGKSILDAVVINAQTQSIGIPAEYEYVEMQCGPQDIAWQLKDQALVDTQNGKFYDLLSIQLKDGSSREFYFEITSFFGVL